MKSVLVLILFSLFAIAYDLSNKPIPKTIDKVKDFGVAQMLSIQYIMEKSKKSYDDIKQDIKKKMATYPNPKKISKMFVKAYLASDDATMLKIAPKEIVDKLKQNDNKVRDIFKHIDKYDIEEFKQVNGHLLPVKRDILDATVYIHIENKNIQLKFVYVWIDNRWILLSIL